MMTKQDWAPEPLTHDGVWFVDANGHQLGGPQAWELDEATINRMLAAYNACAEVPTAVLEKVSYIQLTEEHNRRAEAVVLAVNELASIHDDPDIPVLRLNSTKSIEEAYWLHNLQEAADEQ